MSQPVWTSLDPLTISGGTLDVGHGDWMQNDTTPLVGLDGKQPAPKWLPWIWIGGMVVYGNAPQMPSVAASTAYPGELPWGSRLSFDLAPWADGFAHSLAVSIFVAQYFKGWGDHPADAWEWGNFNSKDGSPAALSRWFTIGAAPPPAQPNVPAAIAELENVALAGIRTLEGSTAYKRGYTNVVNGTIQAKVGITDALVFLKGTA